VPATAAWRTPRRGERWSQAGICAAKRRANAGARTGLRAWSSSRSTKTREPAGPEMPFDPVEPLEKKRVQKGGSFLCTDQYCTLHGAQRFATVHRCIAKGMTPAMVSILKF